MSETKTCRKCGETRTLNMFSPAKQCGDGLRPECKPCYNAAEKARDKSHRPSAQIEYKRNHRMQQLFGITLDDYMVMYAQQEEACAICHKPCSWNRRDKQPLVVDHDHVTGRVRGLLCHYCKGMLGWAKDDPTILATAIRYLVEVKQDEAADVPSSMPDET